MKVEAGGNFRGVPPGVWHIVKYAAFYSQLLKLAVEDFPEGEERVTFTLEKNEVKGE